MTNNQNPYNSGNASKASRQSSAGNAQQIEWAKMQVETANRETAEKKRLQQQQELQTTLEVTENEESTTLSIDPSKHKDATMDDSATSDVTRRTETVEKASAAPVSRYPPTPEPTHCAECGLAVGWLIADPFRPDRMVHQDCAGGMRLAQPAQSSPYAFAGGYQFNVGKTNAVVSSDELPPDLPRRLTTDTDL